MNLSNLYLSERKIEILRLLIRGYTNKQIGLALGISPNRVRNHLAEITDATGIHGRTALAMAAVQHGWIEAERSTTVDERIAEVER